MAANNFPGSYLQYLDFATKESASVFFNNPKQIISRMFGDVNLNSALAPVIFMADFSEKGYSFVHKGCQNLLGYSAQYFINGGMDAYLDKWNQNDFKILNEEIFIKNISLCAQINPSEAFNYLFTYSYRFKNKSGYYFTILQKFIYLLSQNNKPIGVIGHILDISTFNSDNKIIHLLEHIDNSKNKKEIIYQNYYFYNTENKQISKRETEILKWISDGLSSKQIADKLKISIYTIKNHRKSMLQKTNCKNTAELLSFAVRQRIL